LQFGGDLVVKRRAMGVEKGWRLAPVFVRAVRNIVEGVACGCWMEWDANAGSWVY